MRDKFESSKSPNGRKLNQDLKIGSLKCFIRNQGTILKSSTYFLLILIILNEFQLNKVNVKAICSKFIIRM